MKKRRKSIATVEIIKDIVAVEESAVEESAVEESAVEFVPTHTSTIAEPNSDFVDPSLMNKNFDAAKTIVTNDLKSAVGTSLRGHVKTTHQELVSTIGTPVTGRSGDGKVTCQWVLKFNCGSIATIYDWKCGETPQEEFPWSVGGTGADVVKKAELFLKMPIIPVRY